MHIVFGRSCLVLLCELLHPSAVMWRLWTSRMRTMTLWKWWRPQHGSQRRYAVFCALLVCEVCAGNHR